MKHSKLSLLVAVLGVVLSGSAVAGQEVASMEMAEVGGAGGVRGGGLGGGGARVDGGEGEYPAGLKLYNLTLEGGGVTPGQLQVEQGFAWGHRLKEDHSYSGYETSTLFAYGVTDRLQIGLTALALTYESGREADRMRWAGAGAEVYYMVKDPEEGLGIALFQGVGMSETAISADSRLILSKDFESVNFTYNFRIGNDFEGIDGGGISSIGTVGHTFGLSRTFGGFWGMNEVSAGLELAVDSSWDEWVRYEETGVYAGPSFSGTFLEHWTLSVTPVVQLTDLEGSPRWGVLMGLIWTR